jgi:tetratricopeptide (TPR) repeat protein
MRSHPRALAATLTLIAVALCGEGQEPLARLRSLQKINDAAAIEAECRALLKTPLAPDQVVAVHTALVRAVTGDARLEALKALPKDFPEKEGLELHVFGVADSAACRSLDYYKAMVERYGEKVTAEVVDKAARPLLNPRRDWLEGAEAVVAEALKRFPGDSRLLDILADVCLRTRRQKESVEFLRQAIASARTPEIKKEMYGRLARNLAMQGKDEEARQASREIIREWPDSDWARETLDALALAYLRAEGPERGAKVYQSYVETYTHGKWLVHCLTSTPGLYQLDGQYDRAVEETKRFLPLVNERLRAETERNLKAMPSVEGQVLDEKGRPVANATVTLARRSPIRDEDHLIVSRTKADAAGRYAFRNLAWHTAYEFLAATKPDDPPTGLSTVFGPTRFDLELNQHKVFDIRFGRTPLRRLPDPPAPKPEFDDGVPRRPIRTFVLREWTERPWPLSPLHYAVELPRGIRPSSLRLVTLCGQPVPFQYAPRDGRRGTLTFFAQLPAMSSLACFLFGAKEETRRPEFALGLTVQSAGAGVLEVSTGPASFRVPAGLPRAVPPAMHVSSAPPPVLAVKGPDGVWRGRGTFVGRGQVASMRSAWVEEGPLLRRLRLDYGLEGGGSYEATLSFYSGMPYVIVSEKCSGLPVEFRFSAYEGFEPNRVALGWINKLQAQAIACREKKRLIEMPRYVMWAPPGEGDSVGFFSEAAGKRDLIATFPIHPGDWTVQSMERWRAEVLGDRSRYAGDPKAGGREAIDAFEDKGDAYFAYSLFAGERRYGIAVVDKENAPDKIADLRTSVGEVSLDWYKDLVLDWDEEPVEAHPRLSVRRDDLRRAVERLKTSPLLQKIVEPKEIQWFTERFYEGPPASMEFLLTGKPEQAWEARDVAPRGDRVAGIRAGKTRAAAYSPVGMRGLPYQSADAYDALVNANLFGEAERRVLRARMMFAAYALAGGDFMAWRYHAGHRNFDFSRLDGVTAYALCFPANPDSPRLVETAINQFRESLTAFTTDGSGKWQENLGCYYLWSLRTVAAMNARLINCRWPRYDPFDWPKCQLFLNFAVRTVTPEHPLDDNLCMDGLPLGKSYADLPKGRRHPGVGDHGGEGGHPIYDGYALTAALARRLGHKALAQQLFAAWAAGGRESEGKAGINLKGLLALNIADPQFVENAAMKPLASENLPEYGFCFRDAWGTDRETYLLFKCGKGGYRYHFSEGSFVLYAGNRPLSVDGDENFIPARHATITLGPEHKYVGNGKIERHFLHPVADYCRGVFAEANVARSIVFAKNHYFAIRDDAEGETSFVLPLLANKIERRGDPSAALRAGHFHCPGRLGLDVLIYPLGKEPAKVETATDPLLNQQKLTMTRKDGDDHLNVICWTEPGGVPLEIKPVGPGYHIKGPGFEDYLFLTAEPVKFQGGQIAFEGRAGLIRLGAKEPRLFLFDGKRIAYGEKTLDSPDGAPMAR